MPVALEAVWREEADAAVADAQGGGGEAVNVFPVEEGVLQGVCREAIGRLVVTLGQEADVPDRGCRSPFALEPVLTQWAHEISPFVRGVVRLSRKTS